jgi:hypothetical protein
MAARVMKDGKEISVCKQCAMVWASNLPQLTIDEAYALLANRVRSHKVLSRLHSKL